jgi:phosphohistidine phosphatase SixA
MTSFAPALARLRGARAPLLVALAAFAPSFALVVDRAATARAVPAFQDGAPLDAAAERLAPVTVFVVRHAEKGAGDPADPELSEAGAARAAELARVLGEVSVTHLVASEYRRTQATLAPLAVATGLAVEVAPARDGRALAARLAALPAGSVAVVCGHSNTVPQLVDLLVHEGRTPPDGVASPNLPETAHDSLFHVVLPPAGVEQHVRLEPCALELRYGAPR